MDNEVLLNALNLPPVEAIKYFEKKGFKITFNWRDMDVQAHAKAFTVAGVAKVDILKDIHGAALDALNNGTTLDTFRKTLEPTLRAKGWWGERTVETENGPKTEVMGSPWRLKTIFQTNLQTAYMVGRYKGMIGNTDNRPYWKYVAIIDGQTRDAHRVLNGLVFRFDDPFWDSFYPPNGYNCRCRVVPLDEADIERDGLKVTDSGNNLSSDLYRTVDPESGQDIHIAPGEGFSGNPGKEAYSLAEIGVESALEAPPEIRDDFFAALSEPIQQEAFAAWVDETLTAKVARGVEQTLGIIDPETMTFLQEEKSLTMENPLIIIKDDRILHAQGDRKQAPLTRDEFKKLPQVIANPDAIYFDSQDKKSIPTLLYVGPSTDDKVNKIVIKLQQTVKKEKGNWFATAGKIKAANLKDPRYEKISRKK